MKIRRCSILLIEPRERVEFAFDSLLAGGTGLTQERQWIALAPHLEQECVVSADQVVALGEVSNQEWTAFDELLSRYDRTNLEELLAKGLFVSDAPDASDMRRRDDLLRESHWYGHAAVAHAFGRWQGIGAGESADSVGIRGIADLVEQFGPPPPHFHRRAAEGHCIRLATPEPTSIDALLRRRTTCRNFDLTRDLPFEVLSQILHRTFGAQAVQHVTDDTALVKKTSPSAGGLHPTEAYLVVQRVERVAPGLYHYRVGDHALEVVQLLSPDAVLTHARRFVAHQDWLAQAHALVIPAPRFSRNFWKYRGHAKSYRAVTLDVGHLSQTLQISATEFGLGAFVTAAINEADIEQAFGLEPMQESPLAVCGIGWRAAAMSRTEFDPQHAVWPEIG
jgi:putative peptide maturation dehydrogenase